MTTQLPNTEYTLEDLHEIAYRGSYDDMQRSLARALLAAYEQEPVVNDAMALAFHHSLTDGSASRDDLDEIKTGLRAALATYTHPAPYPAAHEQEPVAVPDHLTYIQKPTLENILSDVEENSPMAHAARILAREVKFWRSVPLYTHPAPSIPAAITGDGIKASLSLTQIQIDWICNTCASIYHTSNDDVAQGYIDAIRSTLERLTSIPAVPDERTWLFYCEKYPEMPMGDAIIRAVEWNACRAAMLQAEHDCWIPVRERLPETYVNVLLTDEHDDTCIGQLECEDDNDFYVAGSVRRFKATHWQPLPAPPKP